METEVVDADFGRTYGNGEGDTGRPQDIREDVSKAELDHLKKELIGWREVFVPLNAVLNWEQQYYPVLLVAATTFLFLLIWLFDPSVLTTVGILGLTVALLDFSIPSIARFIFGAKEWTHKDEVVYEQVCDRLLNFRTHFKNAWVKHNKFKTATPNMYLVVLMISFALLAWIGSMINNLLLVYLIVLFFVMLPGLRHKGILQQAWSTITSFAQRYYSQIVAKAKKQ